MRLRRVILTGLALIACGCGANNIRLDSYSDDAPLVIVSDGLFSTEARKFFSLICREKGIPYLGEDNVCWFKNKPAMEEAAKQGREIILIGYSAGCDQVRLAAEWCNERNIPVHAVFFDPTYLAFSHGKSIPKNVKDISVYLSEKGIPDIVAIGKGREVGKTDLRNPDTKYYNCCLQGAHLDIFRNNAALLGSEIRQKIETNRRITYPRERK